MINTQTQQFKNFFLLILFFLSFALPLDCHASEQEDRRDSRRFRSRSTNGDEGLIIAESGDNAEKPNEPEIAGGRSQNPLNRPSTSPLPKSVIQLHSKNDTRPSDPEFLIQLHSGIDPRAKDRKLLPLHSKPIDNTRSLDLTSQPSRRRGHEINSQKPSYIFMFLEDKYVGINDGRKVISNEDVQNFESAMVFYNPNQAPSSEVYNWDSTTNFMSEMDKRFFTQETTQSFTLQSVGRGIFSFAMGFVAATPATGTLVSSIGDFFNIPVGEGLSKGIGAWTMITTTPCFAANLSRRLYIIADTLFGQEVYPTRSDENASKPCIIKISTGHKAAIGLLIFASGLDATVNVGVVALAYLKNFPGVFYGTSWAYFLSWMERYYTTGHTKINRLFCKYEYDTKVSYQKRLLLLDALEKGGQVIASEDSFVNAIHRKIVNIIGTSFLRDEEIGDEKLFALSSLFLQTSNTIPLPDKSDDPEKVTDETIGLLKSSQNSSSQSNSPQEEIKRLKKEIERLESANITLMNFQIQQDTNLFGKEEFISQLNTLLTGAASVGRAVIMEYIIEQLLIHIFSTSAPTATGLAWAASIFDLIYRAFTESDTQQEYMRGWLNSFSLKHLGDFQLVRKTFGWPAIINGGLFSLAKTVAGIYAFQSWNAPIMLQIITLLPAFIQDQAYYGAFFEAGKEEFVTNVATMRTPGTNDHINVKRGWVMHWHRKCRELILQLDKDSIGNLYKTILKGF